MARVWVVVVVAVLVIRLVVVVVVGVVLVIILVVVGVVLAPLVVVAEHHIQTGRPADAARPVSRGSFSSK